MKASKRLRDMTPEERQQFFKQIGSLGGKASQAGGFKDRALAREAGSKGGKSSYERKSGIFAKVDKDTLSSLE